ncbi:ABC transporter substrate-binding protein, partial [Actinokineospora sp. HBU206404]|nr:ABC transporter substrate-binding protein [Actinokineospora xionganensis]
MVTQGRALRGAALAAALILGVSACGSSESGGGGEAAAPGALAGVGPISLVTGKDTSGNL